MNKDNRVIQRIGARELTVDEMNNVTGGIHTLTICTVSTPTSIAGDESGPETC
jgi:bacteriocin-like protein